MSGSDAYRCQHTATGWVIVTPSGQAITKALAGDEGNRFYEALAEFAEVIRRIEQQPRERQTNQTPERAREIR